MRKLFGSVFALSLTLSLVLGAALAWTGSTSGTLTTRAGSVSVALANVVSLANINGDALYPGGTVMDYHGQIQNNTPANSGLKVRMRGGAVSNFGQTGDGTCDAWVASHLVGNFWPDPTTTFVDPGGAVGSEWWTQVFMPFDAPDACQGKPVSCDLMVAVDTE